jgi:hypothetical protein
VLASATHEALARRYLDVMEEEPVEGHLQRGLPGLAKAAFDRAGPLGRRPCRGRAHAAARHRPSPLLR